MNFELDKFYDIDKIVVTLYWISSKEEYRGKLNFVKQLLYVDNGVIVDIFKDKYISCVYNDGNMPAFCYNPMNRLSDNYFTKDELSSGVISGARLLQIYCYCNSKYIDYDVVTGKKNNNAPVIDITKYMKTRRLD